MFWKVEKVQHKHRTTRNRSGLPVRIGDQFMKICGIFDIHFQDILDVEEEVDEEEEEDEVCISHVCIFL